MSSTSERVLLLVPCILGILKLLDVAILLVRDLRFQARSLDETACPPDSVVFAWARRRGRLPEAVILAVFRLPTLTLILSAVILLGERAATLRLAAAVVNVVIALGFLVGVVAGRVMDYRLRARRDPVLARRATTVVLDVLPGSLRPMVLAGVALAYAAFYHALFVARPGSFTVAVGSLGPISSVYFSVVTSATVGYGDIQPTSQVAQLAVTTQIITTAVALAAIASRLIDRPQRS